MRVHLELPEDAGPACRARLDYAFRLFCAIYGHRPVAGPANAEQADVTLRYRGSSSSNASGPVVWLSRGYRPRDPRQPAPPPMPYSCGGTNTVLHAAPTGEDAPDWLGEIFEWVSCADEYSVTDRDSVGRPLFAATYAGRHRLDTTIPYAGIAMQLLQQEICRAVPSAPSDPLPWDGVAGHVVVPTHDVDYFPVGRMHAANRLVRNAVISCVMMRRPWLGVQQAVLAARMAANGGRDPLDRVVALAKEERSRGIAASFNFLVRHSHRLDARYTLEHRGVVEMMRWLESERMEVGLHGSYTCLDQPAGLLREAARLRAQGFSPNGGRLHWLHFTLDQLIPATERAGLNYDTSIGWSERVGFRAGACFAFPPYHFEQERAATFLEIPMVVMEQALRPHTRRRAAEEIFEEAANVLARSRRLGWGGISLLWHPAAFGNGWLPQEVGEVFWRLADRRARWGDHWMKPADLLGVARERYVHAGLLPAEKPSPPEEAVEEWSDAAARTKTNGPRGYRTEPAMVALAQDSLKKA